MPDYKRLVSYIYNYEDGVKRNNVGYARVEARNGQCKCTLHLTAPSINDKQLKAYMFQRKKGGPEGILLGVLQIRNGVGDFKIVTDSSRIMNSPYGLDDVGGIVLYLSDRKFFATEWDDSPVTVKMVAEIESKEADKTRRLSRAAEEEKRLAAEKEKRAAEAEKEKRLAAEAEKEKQLSQAAELDQEVKAADIAVLYLNSPPKSRGEEINSRVREAERIRRNEIKEVTEKRQSEQINSVNPNIKQPETEDNLPEQPFNSKEASTEKDLHNEFKTADLLGTDAEDKGALGCYNVLEDIRTEDALTNAGVLEQVEDNQNLYKNIQADNADELYSEGTINSEEILYSGTPVNSEAPRYSGEPVNYEAPRYSGEPVNYEAPLYSGAPVNYETPLYSEAAVNYEAPLYAEETVNSEETQYSEKIGIFNNYGEADTFTGEYNPYDNSFDPLNYQYNKDDAIHLKGYSAEPILKDAGLTENSPELQEVTAEAAIPKELQSEDCKREDSGKFYDDHPIAKRIYRSFPRMYPFEDNEIAWCVKIEPQDIGLFPMEAWVMGNNSFLLHGYYSYRHLIFAKINDKNGFNYILGVPGIYHNREKFMAKMFGFENFKCVKRKAQRTGEFGYWYVPIVLS